MEITGKLITFEGCEGVGKSSQLRLLKEFLEQRGINAVFTREPGGTEISEKIRGIILDSKNNNMDILCELFLYSAARAQHVSELIKPALNKGKLVICDRFIHSTLAYQGYARGLSLPLIESLNSIALAGCEINATVFLDVPSETGFLRKGGANTEDRLENEGGAFHSRVYRGYADMAYKDSRVIRIDASGTKTETHGKIVAALKERGVIN